MFPKTKQNPLKVLGYKPATSVKQKSCYKFSHLIFLELRNICFQGIIIVICS